MMNQRDLSEIKRRLNPDHRNATVIRGCYVGTDGQIISNFVQPIIGMPENELEKYMALFKKVLSGTPGQNLLPMDFNGMEAMEGEEHQLLMKLRATGLKDDAAVDQLYQRIITYIRLNQAEQAQSIDATQNAANYVILLMHDGYDVPYRDNNGDIDREQSTDVFSYFICAVCPVKQGKPSLSYYAAEGEFHSRDSDWTIAAPELGFMFPSFEERAANIYSALYYTKDMADMHDDFIKNVFNTDLFMPAVEQKETFQTILQASLGEECSMEVVQAVHETVNTMIEERKADKTAEPLRLNKSDVSEVLKNCGVSEEKAAAFEEQYSENFGAYAEIPAVNVITPKQFKVNTPSVSIRVDPEHSDLIETRIIDGKCYILVLADGDIEVNGVSVHI